MKIKSDISSDNFFIKQSLYFILNNLISTIPNEKINIISDERNLFNEQKIKHLLKKKEGITIIFCNESNCRLINYINKNNKIHTINNINPIKIIVQKLEAIFSQQTVKPINPCEWDLTKMEKRIISYYVNQLPVSLISNLENISDKTISAHKRNAMKKMKAATNQELIMSFKLCREQFF